MTDFVTADVHSGHAKIIEWCSRPWSSVEDMEEGLVQRWNETVMPQDRVFILGDLAMDTPNFKKEVEILRRRLSIVPKLHGELHLLPGNHDVCHPQVHPEPRRMKLTPLYEEVGLVIHEPTLMRMVVEPSGSSWHVLLNHFPYAGKDDTDDRYEHLRLRQDQTYNMPLIHGHVHDKWKVKDNMVNVGMDVWDWRPVPIDTVLAILRPFRTI